MIIKYPSNSDNIAKTVLGKIKSVVGNNIVDTNNNNFTIKKDGKIFPNPRDIAIFVITVLEVTFNTSNY